MQKKWIRAGIFACIGICLLLLIRGFLKIPLVNDYEVGAGEKDMRKYPNQYDVLVLGMSIGKTNINLQEMYNSYGIAGVCIAEPDQPWFMTKYLLEEALRYQTPKVVLVDTKGMLYTEGKLRSYMEKESPKFVHHTVDNVKSWKIKWKALCEAREYIPDIDYWEYISVFYYAHNNWKNLSEKYWIKEGVDAPNHMNGNVIWHRHTDGFTTKYSYEEIYQNSDSSEELPFIEGAEEDLGYMLRLCEEKGAQLVLLSSHMHTKGEENSIRKLANEYNVPYLPINSVAEEIGLNYNTDYNDPSHMNLSGAIKWGHYLGEYLSKTYEMPDRRGEQIYERYEAQNDIFEKQKREMNARLNVISAADFQSYIKALSKLDRSRYAMLITVSGDASTALSDADQNTLTDLGLKTILQGKVGSSYCAVIDAGEVKEEFSENSKVAIVKTEEESRDFWYTVTSGGSISGTNASLRINGAEVISPKTGIHVCVWDKKRQEIFRYVYFDTSIVANAKTMMVRTQAEYIEQEMIAPNQWVDKEEKE